MIDFRELRIGNYICAVKGNKCIKGRVGYENGKLYVEHNSPERISKTWSFEPIKLTEDILFKCGLFKFPKDHTIYFFPNVNSTYFLKEENGQYCFCIDYCGELIHTMRSFEYLHQLQNAYFSTYRKDLNIPFPL